MAFVSWRFAGATSIASGMPYFSTAIWILTPRTFLPPSMPRSKTARCRAAGSTVDDHGTWFRRIATGQAPAAAQSVEQAAPQAEPGPAREQPVQRAKGDLAQLADRPPLHAAKADTPDRHDRLAQRRSGQRWLGSRPHRPAAVLGHSLKFRQHLVDEGINISKRIP